MTAKSAAAHEHSQRLTMRYIRMLQDKWALYCNNPKDHDFKAFVDELLAKHPEHKKEIIIAERFVQTGE